MTAPAENWAAEVRAGDLRALSRALTSIENGDAQAQSLLRELFASAGRAWRIGITGAAGTGKSTLVSCLAGRYRAQKKSVGVIAVDPSSPFSGGAILGDRIRMNAHATDDGVFIRSMASRGAWGGLSQAAADAALVLDAAGRDVIILETVGVGQDEIEIVRVADCTLVVVTPGSGDEVQSLKAGLMEIADIFVLNKADNPETERFEQQLLSVLQLAPPREGWNPKTVRTVATEDRGVSELIGEMEVFRQSHAGSEQRQQRQVAYWKSWLLRSLQHRVTEQALQNGRTLDGLAASIAARHKEPHAAVEELMSALALAWKQNL